MEIGLLDVYSWSCRQGRINEREAPDTLCAIAQLAPLSFASSRVARYLLRKKPNHV